MLNLSSKSTRKVWCERVDQKQYLNPLGQILELIWFVCKND